MIPSLPTRSALAELEQSFLAALAGNASPRLEDFLSKCLAADREALLRTLLKHEVASRRQRGESLSLSEYQARFPHDGRLIREVLPSLLSCVNTQLVDVGLLTETWRPAKVLAPDANLRIPDVPGYEIGEFLGRGGMGLVVKARDLHLQRMVALKLPLPQQIESGVDRERFLREARAAARLHHPNICPIYAVGEERDRPYIALAFIAGESLAQWAQTQRTTPRQAAELVVVLAEAVEYAHKHGVVHRDIKPANVMIDRETGQPVLMDFGLAKASEEDVQLTMTGTILGTPAYMAPEQAAGELERVGPHSDVYSLGGVLYFLLTGRPPFSGSFGEIIKLVQTTDPPSPRKLNKGLHRDLETICLKAMAKEASGRYVSAAALAEDCRRFAAGDAILARPISLPQRLIRKARRHPFAIIGTLIAVIALAVGLHYGERGRHMRRISQRSAELDSALEAPSADWTRAYVERLDEMVAAIAELDTSESLPARKRVTQRLVDAIDRGADQGKLSPQDMARLEALIAVLESRDPSLASAERDKVQRRLAQWRPVFLVQKPFTNIGEVFAPAVAQVRDGNLILAQLAAGSGPDTAHTTQTSEGSVELRVTFPASAFAANSQLGLLLNQGPVEGYEFVLTLPQHDPKAAHDPEAAPVESELPADATLALLRDRYQAGLMRIVRSGAVVREQPVRIPAPPVEFRAQRVGSQLTFQIGREPPLVADDIFPLAAGKAGVFGIRAPPGTQILRMQALRQALPAAPSALEAGDELFAAGSFAEALENYRAQESTATGEVRQESSCKQALCLLQLNRFEEAMALLQDVAGQSGDRWPLVAVCNLWLLRVQQRRIDDAELVRQAIIGRYDFSRLVSLVPESTRKALLDGYRLTAWDVAAIDVDEQRLEQLERIREVERTLNGQGSLLTELALLRAYRMLGRHDSATRLVEELFRRPPDPRFRLDHHFWVLEESSWAMRMQGQPRRALALVNAHAGDDSGKLWYSKRPLLVERARIRISLGEWDRAEADLNELFSTVPAGEMFYRQYSAGKLLQGFCRLRHDDEQGAQAAWREGLYRVWQPLRVAHLPANVDLPPELPSATDGSNWGQANFTGVEMVHFILLSSLTGELTEREARQILLWLAGRNTADQSQFLVKSALTLLPPELAYDVFRDMCRSPRGRDIAQTIARQSVDFPQLTQLPMFLAAYQGARQGAFAEEISPGNDSLLWELTQEAYVAWKEKTISQTQFMGILLSWRGTTGAIGWNGIAATLPVPFRAKLAYVMGHRYLRQKEAAQAVKFFEMALADSEGNEPLQALARGELQKLAALPPLAP